MVLNSGTSLPDDGFVFKALEFQNNDRSVFVQSIVSMSVIISGHISSAIYCPAGLFNLFQLFLHKVIGLVGSMPLSRAGLLKTVQILTQQYNPASHFIDGEGICLIL